MTKKKSHKKSQVSLIQKRSNKAQKRSKNTINKKKLLAHKQELARQNLPQAAQQLPLPSSVPVVNSAPGNTINPVMNNIEKARNYVQRIERNSEPYRIIPSKPLAITYDPPKKDYPIVPYKPPKKNYPIVPYTPPKINHPIVHYNPPINNHPAPPITYNPTPKSNKLGLIENTLDYINSGALDTARDHPGKFFDGLATTAMTAGTFLPGPVGIGLKAVGAGLEGVNFFKKWSKDKQKEREEKKAKKHDKKMAKREKFAQYAQVYSNQLNAQEYFRHQNYMRSLKNYWAGFRAFQAKNFRDQFAQDRLMREQQYINERDHMKRKYDKLMQRTEALEREYAEQKKSYHKAVVEQQKRIDNMNVNARNQIAPPGTIYNQRTDP